ncbi:MAG: hypothetical protein JSV86_13925 [Gemmatimonadota bacterium]|nr:MAG: hypothetical protein JSV86_13925 [Gemmatimonadota bacterium]
MYRTVLFLLVLLAACVDSPAPEDYSSDLPPGVTVDYYDFSDGIAPDTVYFVALVGDWNGVDTLFYYLGESGRVIEEGWYVDWAVEAPVAYDPLDELEIIWRAWMAGDTAELIWTP